MSFIAGLIVGLLAGGTLGVLCAYLGPYALIMPPEMVQAWRDKMQDEVDKAGADKGEEDGEK